MHSSRDLLKELNTHMVSALQNELDRQFLAARVVLRKLVADDSAQDVSALHMIRDYANIMFHSVWMDAAGGQRMFVSAVKYCVMISDLYMVLKMREIANQAGKLVEFERQVAECADAKFAARYYQSVGQLNAGNTSQSDVPFQPIVGSYPKFGNRLPAQVADGRNKKLNPVAVMADESLTVKYRQ